MSTVPSPAVVPAWVRELAAGIGSAFSVAAVPITLGTLVYAALGAAAAQVGIPAAFTTVAVGGVVLALLSNARMPALGPTSATALILASLVTEVATAPGFDAASPAHVAAAVAIASAAVAVAGAAMVAFGAAGFGGLVGYVPRPVLSGFMNGVAVMIVLSQLPALAGIDAPAWHADPLGALRSAQPATVAIGIAVVALSLWLSARRPSWPVTLVALVFGTLLYHAVARQAPGVALGGLIGPLPAQLPAPTAFGPLLGAAGALLVQHLPVVLATGLTLAVIGSLESLLNVAALDQQTQHRTDPNRDLRAAGIANLLVAGCGGLAGPQLRLRAMATLQLGGRTRAAAMVGAVTTGVLLVAGAPLLAQLPRVVLAAIMVAIAFSLLDRWSLQVLRRWRGGERAPDLLPSLAIVLVVMLATLFAGFAVAVLSGVLLSMALFIRAMNRALVRQRWHGPQRPSRRVYLPQQEALLRAARAAIEGLELDGALYFGSGELLERALRDLAPGTRFVVLDLRRVSTLEASAANMLAQLAARLAARGVRLMPAGLQAGPEQALRAFGGAELAASLHADADRATEAAERLLLDEAGASVAAAVPLAQSLLLAALDPAQRQRVAALMKARELAAGERLFAEGDPGDALYVIEAGSIALVAATGAGPQRRVPQRYLSAAAGMIIGETALLDGGGRTADAVAESPARVQRLGAAELQQLRADDPQLAAALFANIARHLSQRLRAAATAWRDHAA